MCVRWVLFLHGSPAPPGKECVTSNPTAKTPFILNIPILGFQQWLLAALCS